jgi:hypothetical protein
MSVTFRLGGRAAPHRGQRAMLFATMPGCG